MSPWTCWELFLHMGGARTRTREAGVSPSVRFLPSPPLRTGQSPSPRPRPFSEGKSQGSLGKASGFGGAGSFPSELPLCILLPPGACVLHWWRHPLTVPACLLSSSVSVHVPAAQVGAADPLAVGPPTGLVPVRWGRVSCAVAVFPCPPWETRAKWQGSLVRGARPRSQPVSFTSQAPASAHVHCRDTRHSAVGAAPPDVHVQSPAGEPSLVHVLTYMLLEECLLVGDPDRGHWSPRKISREFEQFRCTELSCPSLRRRQWAIVGAQPRSAAQSRAPPLGSQECAEDSFSPLLPRLIVQRKAFSYFDVLCGFLFLQTQIRFLHFQFLGNHRFFSF